MCMAWLLMAAGLMGPTKSILHFLKGRVTRIMDRGVLFQFCGFATLWQESHLFTNCAASVLSPKPLDQLIVLNITLFEACRKETIRLGDNMREDDKTSITSIPSIMGSKDLDVISSKNSKETSKDVKGMSVEELADLIAPRLNPRSKGAT